MQNKALFTPHKEMIHRTFVGPDTLKIYVVFQE